MSVNAEELSKLIQDPPTFSSKRLLLVVTGSINAALVPYWMNWLRQMFPTVTTSILLTPSAERFVTATALRQLVTGNVWRDRWDDFSSPTDTHVGLDESTDCYGVFPSTLDFTMRLASGRTNSPALMALQTTAKPIAIASSFPGSNAVIERQVELLSARPNLAFTRRIPAFSVGRSDWTAETGFFLPLLLAVIEDLTDPASLSDA